MDIKTVLICLFIVNLFMGFFTFIIKQTQPAFAGINYWIYSSILIAMGYILMAQRSILPLSISIILSHLMFVSAGFLRIIGLNNFFFVKNRSTFYYSAMMIMILFILVEVYFTYINDSILARTLLLGTVLSGISIYIGILIMRNRPVKHTSAYYLASFSFFTFSLIFLIRIIHWLVSPEVRGLFNPDFINNLQFVSSLIIDIVWTTMFFVLHNLRINYKLQESENHLKAVNTGKDQFMTILAHDLKNVFNSILNISELLLLKFKSSPKEIPENYLNLLTETTWKANTLLEDLLYWSASNTGSLSPNLRKVEIGELFRAVEEKMALRNNSKNISVYYSLARKPVYIHADLNMMQSVMRNLLSNAVKFTRDLGKIEVSVTTEGDLAIIHVSDTGIGISEVDQKKLWDISQNKTSTGTAKEKGTGLGLLLCMELVEKHNGRIWVESEPGIGSTFSFTVPLFQ